jgi:hypothetical protein
LVRHLHEDRTISPELERIMAHRLKAKAIEVKASHASLISHPSEITDLERRPRSRPIGSNQIQATIPAFPDCQQ